MDLSRGNEKAIGVFISGSDNKQLGWIPRETISEVQTGMGRMEDLKISLIIFKEKEVSLHFSKIELCHKNIFSWDVICQLPYFFVLVVCKTLYWHSLLGHIFKTIPEAMTIILAMSCGTDYAHLSIKT